MGTSEFDEYKVDHLFLLIGENPLPNYVAAKMLLNEGGKPYLVFSERTQKPAERLKEELGLSDEEMVPLNNNEANAYEIKKKIREKIKEIQQRDREKSQQKDGYENSEKKLFGLNYTGGTKAMAVHAYQAFLLPDEKDPKSQLNPSPIFSYLDSSSLKMLIDHRGNPISLNIPNKQLKLSLEKLFKLHGLSLSNKKTSKDNIKTDVTLPELVEAIVQNNLLWREWCQKILYIEAREQEEIAKIKKDNTTEIYFKIGNWKHHKELINVSFSINGLPEIIVSIIKQNNMLQADNKLNIQHLKDLNIFPKPSKNEDIPKEICKWFEGVWLEDYVLQQLKKIKEECSLDEIGMSFNFPEKEDMAFFEFDVACLRGYQLFAISCTTDKTDNLCKSKLFEAYNRARLMGGNEARVALVCYSNKVNKIKQAFMSQVDDPKVMVFGSGDIADLSEKLKNWIQTVDA
ncbi:DUF1887 family protein [Scytonema sp. UIC 10036]|uniref:Card1-like endonuclease domain-containing protein n=1 Tax=Scytonema sp. UIC 10036 TaxID=2304196 RepID=UPI0012DA3EEC|nr:DUF1887 family protein [Scytonema sp. UIC 10036]MUH00445.1 DUF1887 family protein [Scytonema sp. UIC 10036]